MEKEKSAWELFKDGFRPMTTRATESAQAEKSAWDSLSEQEKAASRANALKAVNAPRSY